jgi:hypothetical protein
MSKSFAEVAPRIVGALNGAHIFGTVVLVKEPPTASSIDSCTAT